MGKIVLSQNAPFKKTFSMFRYLSDMRFVSVSAGAESLAAIREDGTIFFLTEEETTNLRVDYWTDMEQIALSKNHVNMAIGLQRDKRCMIGKRFLRDYTTYAHYSRNFDSINQDIRNLHSIRKVAAGETFVALTQTGTVENICLNHYYDLYAGKIRVNHLFQCQDWKDVIDIDAGNDSLIGITKHGALLETHFPNRHYPDSSILCDETWGVTHACIVGIDPCSVVFSTDKNELWVKGLSGSSLNERIICPWDDKIMKLTGALNTLAVLTETGKLFIMTADGPSNFHITKFEQVPGTYSDVAVGIPSGYFPPFWCAVEN